MESKRIKKSKENIENTQVGQVFWELEIELEQFNYKFLLSKKILSSP